jgi:predicted CXXCH cytochrome family protein
LKLDSQQARLTRLRFSPTWLMPGAIARTAERIGDRAEADLWLGQVTGKRARRLTVGSEQRTVFIGERGPAGWYQARAHGPVPSEPGRHRCSGCHEMADGKLGPAPTPRACETCHSDVAVQTIHRHVTPPLARCGLCHDPHGATRPKLLTDAREKLCTRCHPGGHSKG